MNIRFYSVSSEYYALAGNQKNLPQVKKKPGQLGLAFIRIVSSMASLYEGV